MADRGIVDIALLEVGLSSGNVSLREVSDFTVDDTDSGAKVVKTMTPEKRGIGFTTSVPDFEISLTVMPTVNPEVDWLALRESGETFNMFYEENLLGRRFVIQTAKVTEVSKSFNADGEAELTVKILALNHKLQR
jgi:hypothetical protein